MQNRGAIKFFAIAFALVCLYQLSFTFVTSRVEKHAKEYAVNATAQRLADELAGDNEVLRNYYLDSIAKARESYYLDSISNEVVYNIFVDEYTYKEAKEREINLGLDLKGGMNVVLEVSVGDIIKALSGNSDDPVFKEAMAQAYQMQKNSNKDFVTLFGEAFQQVDPNARLASIFLFEFRDKGITTNSTNEEVLAVIRKEANDAIDRSFQILRTRIDRFGVAQPNIQKLAATGRILIELPGIKDPDRVRKLLQGTAKLEFWETYNFDEIYQYFDQANALLRKEKPVEDDITASDTEEKIIEEADKEGSGEINNETEKETKGVEGDTLNEADTTSSKLLDQIESDTTASKDMNFEQYAEKYPLYAYLMPSYLQNETGQTYPAQTARVGIAAIKDTARINHMLRLAKDVFPRDLKLVWTVKPSPQRPNYLELVALKAKQGGSALGGDVIVDARQDYDQNGGVSVDMQMNAQGAKIWKRLTGENVGRQIAIVLDNYVYSYPNVNDEIPTGRSSISGGSMTLEEAQDLANILKAGKLPAPVRIVEEEVVGPSLGREAVKASMNSFILAFIMVLAYMVVYYNRAGLVANLALVANIFFIFGVLASLGAVLTLPGMAGIVLTLGMAVDANVIIFERIKEEIRAGKGIRLAISDGYKNAYSAIIDGNVTTLLTGIVLFVFGSGPVQGFATTLIIGIITSLFSAIFISRLTFSWILDHNKKINFSTKMTENFMAKANFDFIGWRKKAFILSGAIILIGIGSLVTKGLNYGVDFSGGRTYVIRFDQAVNTQNVADALKVHFKDEDGNEMRPEVKTFGPVSQVKITTKYLINSHDTKADSIVDYAVFAGVKDFFKTPIDYEHYASSDDNKARGMLSSQKVDPTISDDLVWEAYLALFFALIIIFLYIAMRFRNWQYGIGGLVALTHDALIVVSLYSIFSGVLPFDMEVDQAFIAAILTIIGYSINDTVIIFDRIREYTGLYTKRSLKENMNGALNSTLSRTINTSGTTIVVLLTIFIFGGEVIRGFAFALLAGVIVGTYSSVFVASPIAYETMKKDADAKLSKRSKSKK
jgi:SecD/SecF fusion protein